MTKNLTISSVHGSFDTIEQAIRAKITREWPSNLTAEEAQRLRGAETELLADVAVASLHIARALFDRIDTIAKALDERNANERA